MRAHVGDDVIVGIHCHDDTGCAVANSMAAVLAGAGHVQGTLNGLGERTGNANLTTIIPNLQLKLGYTCLPDGRLERLTAVSHHVAELLNRAVNPQAPYVGSSAFAHKAGLHTSAIARAKDAYEHVDPELVGNGTRFVVSEMAGRATITMKAAELGLEMDGPAVNAVIDDLKRLEHEGYHFEAADASLELLMRRAAGWEQDFFKVESMRVITDELPASDFSTEATVKVWVGDDRRVSTAEGNGPVNAIDTALRTALADAYPQLDRVHLTDFKVRILDGAGATGAVTRVLLDATERRSATGRRSASARTSSRRRGGRSRRASSTACCTPSRRRPVADGRHRPPRRRRPPGRGAGHARRPAPDPRRPPVGVRRLGDVGRPRRRAGRPGRRVRRPSALRRHRALRPDVADPDPHPAPGRSGRDRRRLVRTTGSPTAFAQRAMVASDGRTNAYRVVHGENDGLPGLVDRPLRHDGRRQGLHRGLAAARSRSRRWPPAGAARTRRPAPRPHRRA